MSEEECPHGLDAEWCSLCKAAADRAAGRGPAGRGGSAGPTSRTGAGGPRRAGPRPSAARASALRTSGPRASTPRTPAPPLTPIRALAKLRPVLFHVSAYGAWDSIAASGLRTAAKLVADAGRTPPIGLRDNGVALSVDGATAYLRDQRLLQRSRIETHLDGVTLGDWLGILDERVHLFARQNDLTAMLTRYQSDGQDLIVFDTARTLAAAGDRVEVATVATGAPEPYGACRCRGRDTFVPLPLFEDPVADIEEVTIVGGLEDVGPLVNRVVRYHPDRTTEVVWER